MRLPRLTTRRWMVMILVIACGLSCSISICRARARREAVTAIERAGGQAWYEWECRDGRPSSDAEPRASGWLANLLGADYQGDIVRVDLRGNASDKELTHIAHLNRIEVLLLSGDSVTDAGLENLQRLTRLKVLHIGSSKVGDAGLAKLSGLQDLQELSLCVGRITDAGLVNLKRLPRLKRVQFIIVNQSIPEIEPEVEAIRKALPNAFCLVINFGTRLI